MKNQFQTTGIPALEIEDLTVRFLKNEVVALQQISLRLLEGEALGIVGESGSGKTTLGRTIVGIVNDMTAEISGNIKFYGDEILGLDFKKLRSIRGKGLYMIFQDANTHLNPVLKISTQIKEVLRMRNFRRQDSFVDRMRNIFSAFGIDDYDKVLNGYPHQFSGGEKQRLLIIMGILRRPRILIIDEPTASLDTVTKLFVIKELKKLNVDRKVSMLIITHDLFSISQLANKTAVFYKGHLLEYGDTKQLFRKPAHPYTRLLIDSMNFKPVKYRYEKTKIDDACCFYHRCTERKSICQRRTPVLAEYAEDRMVKCYFPL